MEGTLDEVRRRYDAQRAYWKSLDRPKALHYQNVCIAMMRAHTAGYTYTEISRYAGGYSRQEVSEMAALARAMIVRGKWDDEYVEVGE